MTEFLKTVDTILRFNCSFLSVPLPSVRVAEPSEFATVTTKCAVSSTGDELLINKQFAESNADTIFLWLTLSHECRHIWQAKNSADMLQIVQDKRRRAVARLQRASRRGGRVGVGSYRIN